MAATVTSAWAKPGAWALDSEEHEDELKQEPISSTRAPAAEMSDFPDLITAAATKTKKKKGQTLSLGEFVTGSKNKSTNQGLTAEDLMMLPTGPRQRTAEELDQSRLGGGFRSYGDRNNNNELSNSRWRSGRSNGGDDGRRSSREPLGPSRAEETDDWAAAKKSTIGGGFDRRERGGSGGGFFANSRADELDSWTSNKSVRPTEGRKFGGSAFDSLRERRVGNDSYDSDNWGKKREESGGGGSMIRPRLNLQPRKLPVGEVEPVNPKKGASPFGDARPREEVLKQKGEDWKEIDEKLDAMRLKDLGPGDGFKQGFGRPRSTERSWRKNQADVPPPSGENSENGHSDETELEPEAKEDAQK